jgi:hypothetical protein
MNCASCGHSRDLHEHFTSSTHCATCMCPAFAAPLWKLLIDALRRGLRRD